MKQSSKNEIDILDLVNKIQAQLITLERKVDTLINRSVVQQQPKPSTPAPMPPKEKIMHTAICADCKKECRLPFKPSGDRPVYCQDCFSRRKVISMSGMKVTAAPQVNAPELKAKEKKKAPAVKKPVAKKKTTPKKK